MRIGTPWTMVDSVPASQAVLSLQLSGFRGCLGYDGIYTQIVTPDTTQVLGFPHFKLFAMLFSQGPAVIVTVLASMQLGKLKNAF